VTTCDKQLKENKLIFAHDLQGFSPWSPGHMAVAPRSVARQHMMLGVCGEGTCSPHGTWEAERGLGSQYLLKSVLPVTSPPSLASPPKCSTSS
jgi:hypothetical protein